MNYKRYWVYFVKRKKQKILQLTSFSYNPFTCARSSAGRVPVFETDGRRFEPYRAHHIYPGPVAQGLEQRAHNLLVGGSIPPRSTIIKSSKNWRFFNIHIVIFVWKLFKKSDESLSVAMERCLFFRSFLKEEKDISGISSKEQQKRQIKIPMIHWHERYLKKRV